MDTYIEVDKLLLEADMNIMPFIEQTLVERKYNKLKNFITEQGLWGSEVKATFYRGKRMPYGDTVYYFQIVFDGHDEALFYTVEQDELKIPEVSE